MKILEIIPKARQAFITNTVKCIAPYIPSIPSVRQFSDNNITVFGIERAAQAQLDYTQLRYYIAHQMKSVSPIPSFSQIIGDSQLFSPTGTQFAKGVLKQFAVDNPNTIFLYGYTGKYRADNATTDTNHLLTLMVMNNEIPANRVLANIVDYHTPLAITQWPGVVASDDLKYYTLIYTDGEKAEAKFGDDTPTTDGLTNHTVLCFEGGIQSLLQTVNVLNNNISVIGITGLCDLSDPKNPRSFDVLTGKPYLTAASFLQYLKEKVTNAPKATEDMVRTWIDDYLKNRALTSATAKDADTKPALWQQVQYKIMEYKIWEKLDNFSIIDNRIKPDLAMNIASQASTYRASL